MEKSIFFEITDLCNHRCVHCCKFWRKDANHTMTQETLDKILAMPKRYLTISGGEPSLVRDRVFYCLERSDDPIRINTNLTCWEPEDFTYFRERRIALSISVVSMFRKEYEKITQADTFDRFLHNLEQADRASKIVVIVNQYNIENLFETINRLAVKGFWDFIVSPSIPNGTGDLSLPAALRKIESVYKAKRNLRIETLTAMNTVVPANHVCDAGIDRLIVLSNGNIVPCACFKESVLGNINNDFNLREINRRGRVFYLSYPIHQRRMCKGFFESIEKG